MRQLILYYSRSGKNKGVCQELQKALSCDMEEIIDRTDRQGTWNFIKAGWAAATKKTTAIEPIKSNFAYYDVIILSTPFWAGSLPPAIRAFLLQYKDMIKRLALLSISGTGQNNKNAVQELEALSNKRIEFKLVMSEKQYQQRTHRSEFEDFIRALKRLKKVKGDLTNP